MIARARISAAAALVALGASAAFADDSLVRQQRIQELEAKIASLETRQASNSKELAATIDQVLRDAEKRSQLLATSGDASAGYDNGFFIRSGDGFVLRPAIQFQFRHVANYREEVADDDGDDDSIENGFEVRRMRLDLAGTAFTKDLEFFVQWDSPRNSGHMQVLEAWVKYMFADDWGVRLGEFKDPVTHEFVMSSKRLLACDTSLTDAILGGGVTGYTQGLMLIYGNYQKNNPLYVEAGVTDGASQRGTDFTDMAPGTTFDFAPRSHSFDWGVAGRAEYKLMGNWADYRDFTPKGTKEDLLVVGAGADWSQGGDGNLIVATADVQYENPGGFGAYAALLVRHLESELSDLETSTDYGVVAQASYLLSPSWEVFGRYDVMFLDNDPAAADEDTFHEITVGVNYYFGKDGSALHRAKITVDLTYLPNGAPAPATGLGILDDNDGEAEWILRGQFQLLI